MAPIYKNFPQNNALLSVFDAIVAKKPKLQTDILKHSKQKTLLRVALLFLKRAKNPNKVLERNVTMNGKVKLFIMFMRSIYLEGRILAYPFYILDIRH